MISFFCVLIESTLTPIQGFLNFFLGIFGIESANFVVGLLDFVGCPV